MFTLPRWATRPIRTTVTGVGVVKPGRLQARARDDDLDRPRRERGAYRLGQRAGAWAQAVEPNTSGKLTPPTLQAPVAETG